MDKGRDELHLHEQMLLLVLRDEEGTVESKAGMYRIALGGAILSELLLEDRIEIEEGKKKLVNPISAEPLGEPVLDEAIARMAAAKRRRRASAWVSSLAGIKRLRHRIAEGLCRRGILKDSEDTVLLIFKRKAYPTIDPTPERRLVGDLRAAIVGAASTVDARTAILIALAHATGSLRAHFDRQTLKQHRQRLEKITSGDLIGGATREAVRAAQAAAMAAITAATVASTAATS
jgi:Golgi phosphoprotein 3